MAIPLLQLTAIDLILEQQTILEDINLTVAPGQIVSIVGPNGAGKTSLLKVMLGLITPSKGQLIRSPTLVIGYMPQQLKLDPHFPMTVKRFLTLGQAMEIHASLEVVGLDSRVEGTLLTALSGGELQRVLLARALMRKPQLLILDEPAQGVDVIGQSDFYQLIAKIRADYHCGVVLVSHDLHVVMAQTDIVVCLNRHICCSGSPEMVSQNPAFTALFGRVVTSLAFYKHTHHHRH